MKKIKFKKSYIVVLIILISVLSGGLRYKTRKTTTQYIIEQLDIMDVAKNQDIQMDKEKIINENKFMHISLDDFITAFEDITNNENKYSSIFENDTFSYLKMLHDKYGAVISCYTYYESDNKEFDLSKCTDKFSKEFGENSDWLKFGFHTYNGSKNYEKTISTEAKSDYDKVLSELIRITGSDKCIDTVVRLQNFAGNEESVQAMINTSNGIEGLLGADDKRRSYYLNDKKNSYLYTYDYYEINGLDFFKTDLRMELIDDIDKSLDELNSNEDLAEKKDILIIFTHEWQLPNDGIKEKLEKCCKFARDNGYSFDYPINRINYIDDARASNREKLSLP